MPDVREKIVESITIQADLNMIDQMVVSELAMLTEKPGNTRLRFSIRDLESGYNVELQSAERRIEVTKELIKFIKETEGLDYIINK